MDKHYNDRAKSKPTWESDKPYNVKPGLCVIINNMVFTQGKELPGGNKDEDSLHVLFTTLGFDVRVHRNLKATEMIYKARHYGKMKHKGVFFLIVLSHGNRVDNKDVVIGTDCEPVEVYELESYFHASNCPSLIEVPKILMIDACRGSKTEKIYKHGITQTGTTKSSYVSPKSQERITEGTDRGHFAIVFASTSGHTAHTSAVKGSHLTQTFVKVTTEATENESFTRILQEVKERISKSGAHQTVEIVDRLTRDYFIKRFTQLTTAQELHKRLQEALQQWIPIRDVVIQEIQKTAETLKEHQRNVNISRITGSSASIAGSAMAIIGFAIAPFTVGASLGLSVAGVSIAAAGGVTAAGTSIADVVIQNSNVKRVQELLACDYKQLSAIKQLAEKIEIIIESTTQKCKGVNATEIAAVFREVFTQGVFRTSSLGMRITELVLLGTKEVGVLAVRGGNAAARGIATAGIVLNIVLIPIDMYEIIRSSVSLAHGSETRAVERLNEIATNLEEQKQAIKGQAGI